MKKILRLALLSAVIMCFACTGCKNEAADSSWQKKGFDLSLPELGKDGWYMVFEDDFNGTALNESTVFGERYTGSKEIWTTSPHDIRWQSNDPDRPEQGCWWCPEMVKVRDGKVEIHSRYEENHTCSGSCPAKGRFTGGIETRRIADGSSNNKGAADELLFSQAFGYFEATVKVPDADGLWSAFWLQSSNMRKISSSGVDGTEIDIYESAFRLNKKSRMGHALLWNGYGEFAESDTIINEIEPDIYDGKYHTFALKWTPEYYVFYIDGKATWASTGGGVSKVREFVRLTVEIDAGDEWGPHGQKIGSFDEKGESIFYIDSVKVWQNEEFEKYIIDDDKFPGSLDFAN